MNYIANGNGNVGIIRKGEKRGGSVFLAGERGSTSVKGGLHPLISLLAPLGIEILKPVLTDLIKKKTNPKKK